MQLKKSYYIAANACSRKSATTFGDLPDCLQRWDCWYCILGFIGKQPGPLLLTWFNFNPSMDK